MTDYCEDCAMRLFNTKHHNLQGIGNPYFGNVIIVPNVDYDAYKKGSMDFSSQVDVIRECLSSSTGEGDSLYIAPLLRCNVQIACEVTNDILLKCLNYLAADVKKYNYKNILLLGDAATKFLNCNIKDNLDNLIISKNKRIYAVNYSPLIKYVDEDKFKIFKSHLIKWYNFCKDSTYNPYKQIIYL